MGDSRTAPGLDRLACPVCGVAGKGSVYCIRPVCRQAPDQGLIPPVQIMSREHIGQLCMRGGCFGGHHHAGCVFVQPVHNAGPGHPANAGQTVAAMRQKRVHQCAGQRARGRMHHHARGLVDTDQMFILKQDVQGQVRLRYGRDGIWQGEAVGGICADFCRWIVITCPSRQSAPPCIRTLRRDLDRSSRPSVSASHLSSLWPACSATAVRVTHSLICLFCPAVVLTCGLACRERQSKTSSSCAQTRQGGFLSMNSSEASSRSTDGQPGALMSSRTIRLLKLSIVVMTVLIAAGLVALVSKETPDEQAG